jgi:hypothetical protein
VADLVLSNDELNRATLARQLLLERSPLAVEAAVRHLVGLQAQNPLDPYLALWSRLQDFDPHDLGGRLTARELVRIVVQRGTIHLVTADDALGLRPLMQPVLDREIQNHSEFGPLLADIDLAPVLAFAEPLLAARPLTAAKLRAALEADFPDLPSAALAYACRCKLPLVQVPPRGVWGKTLAVTSTPLEAWLGRSLAPADAPTLDDVALRYLAAFGPASVADFASFTRLTGLRPVFERLRPQLVVVRDERGRELFDLPAAPRPPADVPAPVRFLPEYDNVLLSHADRSRFGPMAGERFVGPRGPYKGAVLVDGQVHGIFHPELDKVNGRATLVVDHAPLDRRRLALLRDEAERTAAFWLPSGLAHDVVLSETAPPPGA